MRFLIVRPFCLAFICLILTTTLWPSPRAVAQPVVDADSAVVPLDEIGLYSVGYRRRSQPEKRLPLGWSGDWEPESGIVCKLSGVQNGRQAFLLHCPWRGETGFTWQQFSLRLPAPGQARKMLLRGATAMRDDAVGKSDGVTFRVFVDGVKRLDEHRTDAAWKPFAFDLSSYAGKTVTLRFETDAGPAGNASFDFSLWGQREVVLQGYAAKAPARAAQLPLSVARLLPTQSGSATPPSAFAGTYALRVLESQGRKDTALFSYSGADGWLQYRWMPPRNESDPSLGRISLKSRMRGDAPFEVSLGRESRLEWTQPARLLQSSITGQQQGGIVCLSKYQVGDTTATVRLLVRLSGKSLVFEASCDKPLLRSISYGTWGPLARRRAVTVPFYSGQVFYALRENLFVNAFLDWTASNATSHEGTQAQYGARTDGTRVALRERAIFSAGWHMAEALPNLPNPRSPFISRLGNKVVLDIWGGNFRDISRNLEMLKDAGLDNCAVIIHVWQRSGYDNALPMHFPANAEQGGDAGMQELVRTAKRLGYLIGLHENYVDYYPNYDLFNEHDISLDADGKRVLAWYHPGNKIQSFAVKPNAILRLAAMQSPEIQHRYATNASFLDVHSAVPPWFHVDHRAGEEGAATFKRVWDVHRALWDYERTTHGGPVFGEGHNHWYWSGYLDGAEAQFSQGWPERQGMSAPLMVDFDLLKMHPLQLNHGMGYYSRWWDRATWRGLPPLHVLDQYRMQEVAYGHAGFLDSQVYAVLPLAWLEHHLMSPVTARYAAATPTNIAYRINGKWLDSTAAAKAGQWTQVRVRYSNGLVVTANGGTGNLGEAGHVLPRFGWLARGAGVTAYTALRDGVIVDYAETSSSVFANARRAADWDLSGIKHVQPRVAGFAQTAPRTFRATYSWQVDETLLGDYSNFVHFVQDGAENEGIRFQNDHALPRPTSQWKTGEAVSDGPHTIHIPDNLADGDYKWMIGLFQPGGARLQLQGSDNGQARILLGTVHVRSNGQRITFTPQPETTSADSALRLQHLNVRSKVVDFGTVRTNGSVLIQREGTEWVLRTMPRTAHFVLELNGTRFPRPSAVRSIEGATAQAGTFNSKSAGWWRLPLNGAKQYRWK
ncbi:MAG TPA: DUF5696 domain-containing protein [Abditibacteriaceae bacterium]